MVGAYKIRVHNNSGSYTFELKRNLTVLRGSSGRGKTTLYDMIRDYNRYGKNSGVSVSCDRDIFALDDKNWADFIEKHPGSIIVIDEDNEYIRSTDFARIVKGSDNYFLLITRCYLANLPISVDEIYELTGNKNNKLVRIYTDENRMFNKPYIGRLPFIPEVIITEDSNSGFQFFNAIAKENNIKCISAEGKSNIFKQYFRYIKWLSRQKCCCNCRWCCIWCRDRDDNRTATVKTKQDCDFFAGIIRVVIAKIRCGGCAR